MRKLQDNFIQWSLHFFTKDGKLWPKDTSGMHWLVILDCRKCLSLNLQAHNQLGHKQASSTWRHLSDHSWWPEASLGSVKTCHKCQLWNTQHVFIPITVATLAPLFQCTHLDTMHISCHLGLHYIIQAWCLLTSYVELKILAQENRQTIGKFILQEILCSWGASVEIIMDNRTLIITAWDWLAKKYHINHI